MLAVAALVVWGLSSWWNYHEENTRQRENAAYDDKGAPQKPTSITCEAASDGKTICTVQPPNSEPADKHTQTDLKAQQDVAEWAFFSLLLSACGMGVTVVGTYYVARTLSETRRAINVAEEASRNETRAYVNVDRVELYWGNERGSRPKIVALVKNSGATPAKWFAITAKVFVLELAKNGTVRDCPEFDGIDFSECKPSRWNAIGSNSELSCGVGTVHDYAVLANSYPRRRNISINIAGIVRYETFFGEIFESQYWFFRKPVPGAKITEYDDKDWVTVVTETPIPLTRISRALQSYERVVI